MTTQVTQPSPDQPVSACKLPIKRKSPETPFTPTPDDPNPNPNPRGESGYEVVVDEGVRRSDGIGYGDDYNEEEDEEEDEDLEGEGVFVVGEQGEDVSAVAVAAAMPSTPPPPFKFQRIWSESDEIRFLQGLLACRSQSMTFPRDLNLFFDRFSGTMTQPYTRSQLYEKLRRLRKKFRIVSGRVSRGLDPSTALTPHDRDLFHISTQLWHASCASSSPFSSSPDNKRRKTNKSARSSSGRPRGRPRKRDNGSAPHSLQPISPPPTAPPSFQTIPPPTAPPSVQLTLPSPTAPPVDAPSVKGCKSAGEGAKVELLGKKRTVDNGGLGLVTAKAITDVFDSSLKEVRMELINHVLLHSDQSLMSGSLCDLNRMHQEQRVGELDALGRRMKLVLEHAIQQ